MASFPLTDFKRGFCFEERQYSDWSLHKIDLATANLILNCLITKLDSSLHSFIIAGSKVQMAPLQLVHCTNLRQMMIEELNEVNTDGERLEG